MVGWVGAGMEMVICKHAGQSQEGLVNVEGGRRTSRV